MSTQPSSATDPAARLIAALAERDFPRLAGTLTPDVRMRALIPPGLVEIVGAEAAAAQFSTWFGDAEEFELICSGSDPVADRVHVFYRLCVRKPGNTAKLVEQHLLCTFAGSQVNVLDLVCTGFRPDDVAESTALGQDAAPTVHASDAKRRRVK
jgi:SnoaL-like domain